MVNRRAATGLLGIAVAAALAGCTIVPIAEEGAVPSGGFDAVAYANGLWAEQVLPYFAAEAKPAGIVLKAIEDDLEAAGETHGYRPGEGSPWAFIVSGTGTVQAVNTKSRAGTLELVIDGTEPPLTAVLQIGPVIRGNAIRDSLPFVSFKDFVNQLEYADAGKALTALAVEGFSGAIEGLEAGDRVTFSGATTMARSSDRLQVTPVSIEEIAP